MFEVVMNKIKERLAGIKVASTDVYCVKGGISELINMRAKEVTHGSKDRLTYDKTKMLSDDHIGGMITRDSFLDDCPVRSLFVNTREFTQGGFVDWYSELSSEDILAHIQDNLSDMYMYKLNMHEIELMLGFGNLQLFNTTITYPSGRPVKVGDMIIDSIEDKQRLTNDLLATNEYNKNEKIEYTCIDRLDYLSKLKDNAEVLAKAAYENNMSYDASIENTAEMDN